MESISSDIAKFMLEKANILWRISYETNGISKDATWRGGYQQKGIKCINRHLSCLRYQGATAIADTGEILYNQSDMSFKAGEKSYSLLQIILVNFNKL